MKILVLTQYFWPESFRISDVARDLHQRGFEVEVLTGMPNYPSGKFHAGYRMMSPLRELYMDIRIYRSPLLPRGSSSGIRLFLNYVTFVLMASARCISMPRHDWDVIFVFQPSPVTVGIPARIAKWISGGKLFFWVQDLWPESLVATGAVRSSWCLSVVSRVTKWIYKGCDKILVQSEAFVDPVKKAGIEEERILYFPNWAEASCEPINMKNVSDEVRQFFSDDFCVLFTGNLGVAQDLETILEAASILKDRPIRWILAGDGRRKEWLLQERALRGLESAVILPGSYPSSDMPEFYACADVLLASLKDEPIFALTVPSKIQAYLAAGKPILAALPGEGARMVQHAGAGIIVPPESPRELADAVLRFMAMPEKERCDMGKAGRRYSQVHFSESDLIDKLVELMQLECKDGA